MTLHYETRSRNALARDRGGATENVGRENGGPSKSRGVKMQDTKIRK